MDNSSGEIVIQETLQATFRVLSFRKNNRCDVSDAGALIAERLFGRRVAQAVQRIRYE